MNLDEIERAKSQQQEIWELTVPGRVHVEVTNHLGRPRDVSAVGRGSRLRLSTLDRELAEEKMRREENNPFRNGMLVRVGQEPDSPHAVSDVDLKAVFAEANDEEFAALLEDMTEVNVRRMQGFAEDNSVRATVAQSQIIKETIERRFPLGGTVPSYDEIMRNPIS